MLNFKPLVILSTSLVAASATAGSIKTNVSAKFHKLVHVTLHARAAGTEKPPILIFDQTFPKTQQNQGIANNTEALEISPEILQTEGPIEILYSDFEARKLIPCTGSISQQQGADKLMQINVQMDFSPDGISCMAAGEYTKMSEQEKKDDASHVAHLKEIDQ